MSHDPDLDPTIPNPLPRLGRYELHERVGRGGMAEVFLACEQGAAGLDRWVAIKRIRPALARQRRFVAMLLDEARIAARIAHPNIAQVLDLGEEDGVPYIVMEYLHGQPLSAVLARAVEVDGQPDLVLGARIVAEAAEGAHAAHELHDREGRPLGLVHRDLSPHNVFVTYAGAVKVVDFGIAKAKGRATMTEPGMLKGKFSYMSPEQARGGTVDRRSDVYSLGLVLHEATTGRRALEGDDREILARAQLAQVDPPSRHRKGYPAALEAIAMRAMAPEPAGRYATARELGRDLDRFLVRRRAPTGPAEIAVWMTRLFPDASCRSTGGLPGGTMTTASTRPSGPEAHTRPARREVRTLPWRVALLASAALAGFLGVVLWLAGDRPGDRVEEVAPHRRAARERSPAEAVSPTHARERAGSVSPPSVRESADPVRPTPGPEPSDRGPAASVPERQDAVPYRVPPVAAVASPERTVATKGSSAAQRRRAAGEAGSSARAAGAAAAARPAAMGSLDVRSEPWAFVSVDGQRLQATPVVALPLEAGPHVVVLTTESGLSKRMRVTITPGERRRIDFRFEEPEGER